MGQTIEIFPKAKKIYKKFFRTNFLDEILRRVLNLSADFLSFARRFYFPKKFPWDWKLEMLLGKYEQDTTAIFKKLIKPGMNVIDIGAHIGYYTTLFSKLAGTKGKIFAFEADEDNFRLLNKNTDRRRNIILINKAVSDKTGLISFYKIQNSTGCHSIIAHDNAEKITVPAIALDDYLEQNNIKKIDAIKIDIEGGEPFAFLGMRKLFSQTKNLSIVTEFSPHALRTAGVDPSEFLREIKNYGFEIFQILPGAETKILSLENMESLDWYRTGYANLLLKK